MGVRVLRGGWRRRCSHGAGPGTVVRGREVGRREVEGSAVRRRRVGMPCGFAGEVELVTSESRRVTSSAVTHSLTSRPPNNTLNTQSRAQQTHSRSRSLRAHPRRADPPSVMPRAARLGRRSWVGRHRQAERLGHLLRGRVLHRHREALR
eukprot:scaffold58663_cov40-Phaeocystis_antarctica.AAC.1